MTFQSYSDAHEPVAIPFEVEPFDLQPDYSQYDAVMAARLDGSYFPDGAGVKVDGAPGDGIPSRGESGSPDSRIGGIAALWNKVERMTKNMNKIWTLGGQLRPIGLSSVPLPLVAEGGCLAIAVVITSA